MAGMQLFSAERRLIEKRHSTKQETSAAPADEIKSLLADMRREISELRSDIAELKSAIATPAVPDTVPFEDGARQAAAAQALTADENILLKTELRVLARCIKQTKSEICALHPAKDGGDHLLIATNELDAVVASTEEATQSILDSVEAAEAIVRDLRFHVSDTYVSSVVDDVLEKLVAVLVACNFQDITGQRITKVINTMKYIEERIDAMTRIWDVTLDTESPPAVSAEGDAHLLNGPQLSGKGCSQADVDSMFD